MRDRRIWLALVVSFALGCTLAAGVAATLQQTGRGDTLAQAAKGNPDAVDLEKAGLLRTVEILQRRVKNLENQVVSYKNSLQTQNLTIVDQNGKTIATFKNNALELSGINLRIIVGPKGGGINLMSPQGKPRMDIGHAPGQDESNIVFYLPSGGNRHIRVDKNGGIHGDFEAKKKKGNP
jgi:hypothetical protein